MALFFSSIFEELLIQSKIYGIFLFENRQTTNKIQILFYFILFIIRNDLYFHEFTIYFVFTNVKHTVLELKLFAIRICLLFEKEKLRIKRLVDENNSYKINVSFCEKK